MLRPNQKLRTMDVTSNYDIDLHWPCTIFINMSHLAGVEEMMSLFSFTELNRHQTVEKLIIMHIEKYLKKMTLFELLGIFNSSRETSRPLASLVSPH